VTEGRVATSLRATGRSRRTRSASKDYSQTALNMIASGQCATKCPCAADQLNSLLPRFERPLSGQYTNRPSGIQQVISFEGHR
jgi:hypothetical protein